MINRAKCKLCKSVIESFHATDYVQCSCGEIAVDGGEALKCYAKDFSNFMRVDDLGNEIIISLKNQEKNQIDNLPKPTKDELFDMLDEMIKNIEKLPPNALSTPITHYDLLSSLLLISACLRAE